MCDHMADERRKDELPPASPSCTCSCEPKLTPGGTLAIMHAPGCQITREAARLGARIMEVTQQASDPNVERARRALNIGRYSWGADMIDGRYVVGLIDHTGEPGSRLDDADEFRALIIVRDGRDAGVLLGVLKALDAKTTDGLPIYREDIQ